MNVPGRAGYSLLGDESLEFWKGPRAYLEKRCVLYGHVFLGRILNKPTVFLTSSRAVKEALNEKSDNFSMGYREFMFELFEENLIFLEGDAWQVPRDMLYQVFNNDNLSQSMDICKQLISNHTKEIPLRIPLVAYQHFKVLTTQLSINLFLSHTLTQEEAEEISQLMTTHWHGIISVPLSVKVPWLLWKSGFGKALDAKDQLLKIISQKLQTNPSPIASSVHSNTPSSELAIRNLLIFISALIPKALASVMTSILLELAKPENSRYRDLCLSDDQIIEDVILECQRLWPPFLGGRRACSKSCEISGFIIPKGHSVVYATYTANRDETVFREPDKFRPERWREENSGDRDLVWTFGGGPRTCIGKHLTNVILKEWLKHLLTSLAWELPPGQDISYKMLPVIRPTDNVQIIFNRLDPEPQARVQTIDDRTTSTHTNSDQ